MGAKRVLKDAPRRVTTRVTGEDEALCTLKRQRGPEMVESSGFPIWQEGDLARCDRRSCNGDRRTLVMNDLLS